METIVREIGKWSVRISCRKMNVGQPIIQDILKLLEKWNSALPFEPTYSQLKWGVKSIIVKIDCVIFDDTIEIYEIEDSPAGMGICCKINPQFRKLWKKTLETCPEFVIVKSEKRQDNDDSVWANKIVNISGVRPSDNVIVRAGPREEEFWGLQSQSLSTIRTEGCKRYGEEFGWWKKVRPPDFLPWDKDFVLKPTQGTMSQGVVIFLAKRDRKMQGSSTKKHIKEILAKFGEMYLQEFIPPMNCPFLDNFLTIYRLFFAFDCKEQIYIPLGGAWNARRNYKIHGAQDTIWGPLEVI